MEYADQLYADAAGSQIQPAEYGKTELSLMHFTVCALLHDHSVIVVQHIY